MALVAQVEDGQIVETTSQSSLSNTSSTSSSSMDKDAFLQLLVAQMKYQDPLEPTSNTEFISQYAQFSQVESLQNMSESFDLQRASALVGEEVYIKTTSSSGVTNYIQGRVDYVVYENNKAYLSINEQLYSLDDLDTVVDAEYLAAYQKATEFVSAVSELPNVTGIDLTYAEEIDALEKEYNEMTDYEKSFIASDVETALEKYIEKIKELRAVEEADSDTDDTDSTEETEDVDGTDSTEDVDDTDSTEGTGEEETGA